MAEQIINLVAVATGARCLTCHTAVVPLRTNHEVFKFVQLHEPKRHIVEFKCAVKAPAGFADQEITLLWEPGKFVV